MHFSSKYKSHGLIRTGAWTNKIAWNNLQSGGILVSTVNDLQVLAKACLYQSHTELVAVLVVLLHSPQFSAFVCSIIAFFCKMTFTFCQVFFF